MADNIPAARRRLRRIPNELRKRASQSCDLCRNKRCRCVPDPSGKGCVACQAQKVECSYALPRKTRFYGSLDDLSDRYKCLEAIVRGAFPNDPISTAAELIELGRRMGYGMPELSRKPGAAVKPDELMSGPPAPEAGSATSREAASKQSSFNQQDSSVADSLLSPRSSCEEHSPTSDQEPLGLIRDTSGREHYIGPSGSLQFLGQLRRLLSLSDQGNRDANSPNTSSKFAEDDKAHALEAEGHKDTADPAVDHLAGLSSGSINSSIAKDFTWHHFENVDDLISQLPPQPHVSALLQSYFKNDHEDFPLFHRGTFEEEYESYFIRPHEVPSRRATPNQSPADYGWIGCLHMMLVFGSMSDPKLEGFDHIALRGHCVFVTRTLLPQLVSRCTLSSVRALLLLSLFLHNNNERNAAWNLAGTATRICFALGLHRNDTTTPFRPIERELRKRVFCTLYMFEQFLSSSLGRPSGLNDLDVQVTPPREAVLSGRQDGDDELLSLSLKLQMILSRARLAPAVSNPSMANDDLGQYSESAKTVLGLLDEWKSEVAKHRGLDLPAITEKGDPHQYSGSSTMAFEQLHAMLGWQNHMRLRATLLLHLQYRYIAVLVTRPFLLRDVASGAIGTSASMPRNHRNTEFAAICVQHACQLSRIVLLLDSFDLINGISGLDVFYAYSSAMVLILRSLKKEPESTSALDQLDQHGSSLVVMLRDLTARLREAVSRVDKSGTMRRFASVMALFEETAQEKSQNPGTATRLDPTLQGNREQPSHRVLPDESMIDPHLDVQPPMPFAHGLDVAGTHSDMWSQSDLVTFEGMSNLVPSVGPFLGVGHHDAVLDWANLAAILSNYGPPT